MMETWKECGWAPCGKRFEPGRRNNQHLRASGRHHSGAVYCSRSCQQKAYRWRVEASRKAVSGTITHATVTRPFRNIENTERFSTKTTMLDRYFHCLRATSIPIGNHPGNRTGHRPARSISRYPTFSNASRPFLSHQRAFWSQPNNDSASPADDFSVARPRPLRRLLA